MQACIDSQYTDVRLDRFVQNVIYESEECVCGCHRDSACKTGKGRRRRDVSSLRTSTYSASMPPPPSSFALHTALLATGQTYSYLDLEGASPDAPTLLLLHGFPDSW